MRPELGGREQLARQPRLRQRRARPTVNSCTPCRIDGNSFEPRAAIKGDLARGLFYMAVRYDSGPNLEMAETLPTSGPFMGKLSTLVAWSLADPPDDVERARNNLIDDAYQHNRNPFIDHPEWVCSIWGSQVPASTLRDRQPPAHHGADDEDDHRGQRRDDSGAGGQ